MLRQALRRLLWSSSDRFQAASFLVAALSLLLVAAAPGSAEIPPKPTRWATDEAGFLVKPAVSALDARLESYERNTGLQVVLWIGTTTALPLEEFANRTFQAWQLGRKGQDDGVLILVLATD